ncbi:MAG: PD40 domain-containing protein, partial [Bacteroidaceae bacterium]|nr:PD40 domain-containing protein [Bacteroidaceae bacterium]
MNKHFFMLVFCLFSLGIHAQESPLWMRYNTISPDGKTIAFCYKGDIYTVPVSGGRAFQVTTNPSYDTHPVWSPDSKNIAFSSNREGSFDIYIVSKDGGIPRRLTTHSAHEYVETFKDNDHILYKACIQWDATHGQFPSNLYPQIYEISTKGGRPTLFSSHTMEEISVNKKGDYLLYTDKKGYEDTWRKHHKS